MKHLLFSSAAVILTLFAFIACHKTSGISAGNYKCTCEMVEKTPPGVRPNNGHYTESYTNVTLDDAKSRCSTLSDRYNANRPISWIYNCALE